MNPYYLAPPLGLLVFLVAALWAGRPRRPRAMSRREMERLRRYCFRGNGGTS